MTSPKSPCAPASEADSLRIGGFVPLTTVDYPGKLAAVVFLQGCPWRCPYCHNQHLRNRDGTSAFTWSDVFEKLNMRRGLLEAVLFSGGEPTWQTGLVGALKIVRQMGFATGLHTAGIFPHRLARILPYLDWIGLDAKAPPDARYDVVTGFKNSARFFLKSLQLIQESGVPFQVRTTVDPSIHSKQDIKDLQHWAEGEKIASIELQPVR